MHWGISTKQEIELLSCDLTSFYLCQSFTDLQWSRTLLIKKSKNQKFQLARWSHEVAILYSWDHPSTHPPHQLFLSMKCGVPTPNVPPTNYVWCPPLVYVFPHPNCFSHQEGMCSVPPPSIRLFSVASWILSKVENLASSSLSVVSLAQLVYPSVALLAKLVEAILFKIKP